MAAGIMVAASMLLPAGVALAYSPTLTLTDAGSGNSTIAISGGASYATVSLYYSPTGSSLYNSISNFGTTNGGGYFSTTVNASAYGITSGSRLYAIVGGDVTNTVNGYSTGACWGGCNPGGSLTFSQSNVNVNVGQSVSVTANYYSILMYPPVNNLYISSNSNPNVATANVNGNTITMYGQQAGTTQLYVCVSGSNQCGYIYVTVGGSATGSITFSQNNPVLNVNQSFNVYVYSPSGAGNFYVQSVTPNNIVSTSISGSSLNLYGQSNGSATVTVCQYNTSYCGYLYVTVGNGGGSGNIWLNQTSVNLNTNQNTSVVINGTSGSYYVSSNSNSWVASASISGNMLYVTALQAGNTTISVCQNNSSGCATLYVTVNGGTSGGSVWFSNQNPSLTVGQSQNITISSNYYGSNYYISSNSNSNAVTASISGSNLYIYGQQSGSSTITVCQYNNSQCGSLYVTVSGGSSYGNIWFSPQNPSVNVGQSVNVTVYGNGYSYGNGYYVSTNSNPNIVTTSLSGSTLTLYGQQSGSSTITVCQYNVSNCGTLYVTVNGSVLGGSTYANGTLIQEGQTIYIVYRNQKIAFGNWQAFEGFGFRLANVINVGYSNLPVNGYVISSAYGSHPWGSWIKSGNTVYFVHDQGLIPVGDYATFLNNGGQDAWVVSANSWDFTRPILPIMTYNDYRLK